MSAAKGVAKGFRKAVEKKIFHGVLKTYIPAGMASGSPPLGTQLGVRGVNIPGFVKDFNERTKNYKPGIPIPSIVDVKPDRSYKLTLQLPPMSYYLFQAAGINRGAMKSTQEVAGKVTLKHVYEIAVLKSQDIRFQASTLQEIVDEVVHSARTCGIAVVRDLDPNEYGKFLEERSKINEAQRAELQAQREAKLLRAG
ncbi:39S ribosomal protein L11, mitochondrial [Frankliniella fusca]|uniref:Large ribosomal subunit protein uL11m n=1 Tax=Frankliniella fusca TaxID=407009 RepID=A0AAE1GTD3_9NEOP|nr:39S ribosomal protein L11, mitochondrial [Frankliniella fusca]